MEPMNPRWSPIQVLTTLESGINVGVRLLIFEKNGGYFFEK
jgi:hypothetical protein